MKEIILAKYGEIILKGGNRPKFEKLLIDNPERCLRIPMISEARCLNLSNSVAIVVYEALRQNNFENMLLFGKLKDDIGRI